MRPGWRWTLVLLLVLVGVSFGAGRGGESGPAGLGVPALLFPPGEAADRAGGEVADRAERRLRAFLSGSGPDSLVLGEEEVGAVVRRRLEDRLPRGVVDLRVELLGPTAAFSAKVRFRELRVGGGAPERLSRFLGDSARVELEVDASVTGPGSGRVELRALRAGGIELPGALIPFMLSRLGVETVGGDDPAVRVPLPRAITSVRVARDTLVVSRAGGA